MINSIGLPNKGLRGYLEHDLPELAELPVPLITNVMGSTAAEVSALVEAVGARDEVAAIELNVSCPNVKTGLDIGADPAVLGAMLAEVRPRTSKPLIVKLTPNTADVALVAEAAEAAGADAVSLINTLRAYAAHPSRPARAVARQRDGRPVGPGDPRRGAGAGARGRRARRRAGHRHGRRRQRARRREPARCGAHRWWPSAPRASAIPRSRGESRRELAQISAKSGDIVG